MIDYIHNVSKSSNTGWEITKSIMEVKDENVQYRQKIIGFIFRNSGVDVYWRRVS